MSRCARCGKYVDAFEWPEHAMSDFRPNLCYSCFQEEKLEQESDEEEEDNFDPNTGYGMSEVKPNPDDDDTPDLGDIQDIENTELEESHDTESEPLSDEEQSIRNLQRLLFG